MKFSEIVDEIGNITDIRVLSSPSGTEISRVRLWENHPESEMDTTLYFGYGKQPEMWPSHYILACDQPDETVPAAAAPDGPAADLAVIPERQFAGIFNHIQDILAERNRDDYQRYLVEAAEKAGSVDALIDMASLTFNASLVLIDRDFRILSHSTKIPVTDKLWADNIQKGYCDYEFIAEVKNLKSVKMANPGNTPFEVTCSSSPYRKLACRVYCKDAWIGSLLLIEGNQTYRPEHAEMLRMLSSVTGDSLLEHSPGFLYRTSDYQSFLYNLLIGTPPENLPEAYRGMEFQEEMKLLYFRSDSEKTPPIKDLAVWEAFHREMPECHVISHRKATIVICSLHESERAERLLTLFPPEQEISAGISRPFRRTEVLRKALGEAQDALTVGRGLMPERRIFSFEEFSVPVMLKHLSETEDISRYLHPAVLLIAKYDGEYGAKLLPTLQTYLMMSCSIKETAEALFLHRNSIIYRLRKAEEIGGLDLNDAGTRFALRMSFYILQVKKP